MRLLLVSHSFPPTRDPESFLAGDSARALSQKGWDVTVLTIRANDGMEPVDGEDEQADATAFTASRTRSPEHALYAIPIAGELLRRTLLYLGLPNAESLWFPFAVQRGKRLLAEQHYDVLYSRAFSPVSHMVALTLKRISGCPWVAHWGDPWVDSPYFKPRGLQRRTCLRLEEQIMRAADAIEFITPQAADLVMAKYPPSWRAKVHISPHAYDPASLPVVQPVGNRDGRLHLVHTGRFYGQRSPEPLLRALALLKARRNLAGELRVTLVGQIVPAHRALCRELGLDDVVTFAGPLTRRESLLAAAEADLLLLVDAPSEGPSVFLPSKLIDYLSLARPILGITPAQGASADVLHRLGCPQVEPHDVDAIAATLAQLLDAWQAGNWALPPTYRQAAQEFRLDTVSAALDALLRSVAGKGAL